MACQPLVGQRVDTKRDDGLGLEVTADRGCKG